ncbi:hypothetical protein L6164_014549 [Bauhinia variegata]|uniref:Uncharacterized protein n=1 Tax=Bauhinia variegata TaxID=167791 RepID=A0ACB9NJN9_BAUVA|nr:hypothetical protein L6164_014549 [Bauhinia variegata]
MVDHLLSVGSENLEQTCTSNFLHPSPFRNPNTKLQQGSMVVIRDFQDYDENFVFPPSNHENLHINSNSHQFEHIPESPSSSSTSCSSSSSTFSPSETDMWGLPSPPPPPSDFLVRKNSYSTGWMGNGLEILRSKIVAMFTPFRNYSANKADICSIGPAASAVLMSWWMCIQVWRWLRRRRRQTREDHLMTVIKQKDEVGNV